MKTELNPMSQMYEPVRTHILLESLNGQPVTLGRVNQDTLPGSISSDEPHGRRRLYVFGWRDGQPGVWESEGGIDLATPAERDVFTLGYTLLSDLSEPYEFTINRAGVGPRRLRLTLVTP